MRALDFNNKWVLVTGASSGLGYEMARQLAHLHGANLVITARRKDKLELLKTELEQQTGIQVKIVVADLSLPEDVERLIAACLTDQQLYAAILNAGVTYFGLQTALSQEKFASLMQTNVTSVVRITDQLVRHFEVSKCTGGIMIVSSMAALYPTPYQAVYSGTKGFLLNYANAFAQELKHSPFSLTVFAPGGIATEMTAGEKFNDLKAWLMPVKQAAREGIYALQHRKLTYIPGLMNRVGSNLMRLLPKKLIISLMAKSYKKSLEKG
ncbi:SDR family NAD(P)-dependent oxidoreductase [Pedobacter sp. MC2016-14]|uniref:SDR family NAD(P)-dependent oxidoreductase n=1 Tax=Pedobacter sp. MC2016-14 TaxID=2897327 RepID=UPI001E6430FA|nr:SDR family NAD(P)-dependent oxidoreductase [Pedobacter sp. MC2016-14]